MALRIKKEYLERGDSAPYVKGKTQYWVIGPKDVKIKRAGKPDTIRKCIPANKIKEEFIDIGIDAFFEDDKKPTSGN